MAYWTIIFPNFLQFKRKSRSVIIKTIFAIPSSVENTTILYNNVNKNTNYTIINHMGVVSATCIHVLRLLELPVTHRWFCDIQRNETQGLAAYASQRMGRDQ